MLGLDPREWPAVSALLDQAMDLPRDARIAWLEALPPASAIHRDTLVRLLAADGGVETCAMFEAMPSDQLRSVAADDGDAALVAGSRVGPYVLLSQIGRGGMGSVWLAERADSSPRRKVALKLPHLGWAPGLAERVDRERDILASLEHPNIARLYDAGVDAMGRPYLALEYVEGTPIDRYAAEHGLGVDKRLRLLLQVAAAVAHAHAHLAVHRDLKPSNILVTAEGDVRLLDFGIAKLLEDSEGGDSELTRLHGQALTPDYASPEQIRGERVGTASDVYSLGVVAYELLTGDRPYRLAGRGASWLVDAVDTAQIEPASRRAGDPATCRALRGDLDAILNKALKKLPAERYATVQAFAADVERHRANQPVLAQADTVAYRIRKYVARHAVQAGATAIVALAIVAGAGVALWQAHAARLEAIHADQEARRAEQVKRFALSIFEDADTDAGAGAQTTVVDLLKQAEGRAERELVNRPDTEAEVLTSIAYSLRGQGRIEDSAAIGQRAAAVARRALGADALATLQADVVAARALRDLGRDEMMLPVLRRDVEVARRTGAEKPLAEGLLILASAANARGDDADAVRLARESIAVMAAHPADFTKLATANAWIVLASLLRKTPADGELDAANRGAALMREIYGDRPVLSTLTARMWVANAHQDLGDLRAAASELRPLYEDARRLLGPDHPRVAFFAKALGDGLMDTGDVAAAIDAYGVALGIAEKGASGGRYNVAVLRQVLADAAITGGRNANALAHAQAGLAIMHDLHEPDPSLTRDLASAKGMALLGLGRLDDAELELDQVLAHADAGRERALVQGRLALLRSLQGRHGEAVQLAQESAGVLKDARSPRVRADAERVLGASLLAAGRPADAALHLQKAIDGYQKLDVVLSQAQQATATDLTSARLKSRP